MSWMAFIFPRKAFFQWKSYGSCFRSTHLWRSCGEAYTLLFQRLNGGGHQAELRILLEFFRPFYHQGLQFFTHLRVGLQQWVDKDKGIFSVCPTNTEIFPQDCVQNLNHSFHMKEISYYQTGQKCAKGSLTYCISVNKKRKMKKKKDMQQTLPSKLRASVANSLEQISKWNIFPQFDTHAPSSCKWRGQDCIVRTPTLKYAFYQKHCLFLNHWNDQTIKKK